MEEQMAGLYVVIDDKKYAVPLEVEAAGAEAIEAHVAQLVAKDQEADRLFGASPVTEE